MRIAVFIWSFIASILVSSFVRVDFSFGLFFVLVGCAVLAAEWIWKKEISKEILFCGLALSAFGLGALRYDLKDAHSSIAPTTTGVVSSEPENRDSDVRFTFTADNGQKALVTTDMFSTIRYGDEVQISGKFKTPGIIDDGDGSRPFDYGAYLAKDDIYATMSFAKVKVISYDHGNPIIAALLKIKNAFTEKMKELLPEPESSLLAGLTISGKEALPKDIVNDFTAAGVVQVIVLSGYNVTIIAEFFLSLFAFLGLEASTVASAVGIILFTLMTGATASVVRAAIMILVVLFGKSIGRQASSSRLLLFTAFLMLLQNPKILVFDPSFQLSFIAMLALVFAVPVAEKYLQFIPEKYKFRTLVATTLAVQGSVFPFLLYNIGSVSLVALPANFLILFVVPLTMLVGFIATSLAFISQIIALPFTYVSHLLLAWILWVAHIFGHLSFSTVAVANFPMWAALICYAVLIAIVWRLHLPAQPGNSPRISAN